MECAGRAERRWRFFRLLNEAVSSFPCHRTPKLRQQFFYHVASHIGQANVATIEPIRQLLVIHTQEMQDRGVEVIDRADLLGRLVSELIGGAVAVGRLDTGAGEPGIVPIAAAIGNAVYAATETRIRDLPIVPRLG